MVPDISKHVEEATPALRYLFLGSYFLRTIHNFLENKKEEDIFTITSKFMFFINKKSTMYRDIGVRITLGAYFQAY